MRARSIKIVKEISQNYDLFASVHKTSNLVTDRQTDRRTDGQTDRQTDRLGFPHPPHWSSKAFEKHFSEIDELVNELINLLG